MEENKNPGESSGRKENTPAKKPDHDAVEKEILEDLNNNSRYKKFYDRYNSSSVESFKTHYAGKKAFAILYGEMYEGIENGMMLRYKEMAEDHIWRIQQRKLFDLQCRWRAEEIKIKEITLAVDFKVWEAKIEECTFITPISQDEFDLYMEYVRESDFEDVMDEIVESWQEYDDFKEQYLNNEADSFWFLKPTWYEFYEHHTGLSSLYYLDDVRGKKEKYYCVLSREHNMKMYEEANKNKPKPEEDNRPKLDYLDNDTVELFMNEYEEAKMINKIRAFEREMNHVDDEELRVAIETLQHAEVYTPINYNDDWREGIIKAAGEYEKEKLIEALPKAYNNYLFRINNGLGFGVNNKNRNQYLRDINTELILSGRRLSGEPEDFNF